ncbi:hypothetical protein M0805_005108 [Coniferiporia weirii]|nr:hypothetical protein M0805_005108 [Coniferiporia weirii]
MAESLRSSPLNLVPPLYEEAHLPQFLESGRTVSFALSPRSNTLATFATPIQCVPKAGPSAGNLWHPVYTAGWDKPPTVERRVFITDTSVVFAACRKFIENEREKGRDTVRSPETIVTFRKLASDYILHLQDCWVHSTQLMSSTDGPPHFPGEHYRSLYTSLSLFQILYLPEDGIEDVPVGDELLEWLNTHFIEPSTEEGDQLSAIERPWEGEIFWPYLIRATLRGLLKSSIFFLRGLANHPSENLQRLSERLVALLEKHPRQRHFSTEKEFFTTSRRWRDRAKTLRIDLDRIPENDRNDGFENWWDNVSDLVGILEGREDVLQRVCTDLGGGWKEIICAYGVWVDVGLRRAELPDIVGRILPDLPPDPTDNEDSLHAELFQGRPMQALTIAYSTDVWLAAHLADIMGSIGLLDREADEETGLTVRDQYMMMYTDYLHSDPGLWRLAVDYLCTCGEIGKQMADEVLIRVPMNIVGPLSSRNARQEDNQNTAIEIEMDTQIEDGDLSGVVRELNATCFEHRREHARRVICRVAARKLAKLRKYGLAISYCRSAEDWKGLGHIVDSVLEEYILHGPLRYVPLVADIAPLLQELRAGPSPHGVFVHRLMFAVRYAEFHQRNAQGDAENAALDLISMFEEDLAPRAWWGVILNDAIPFLQDESNLFISSGAACLLLRRLGEVSLGTGQGCGDDYLSILARTLNVEGSKEALKRLDVLRLALARYLASSPPHLDSRGLLW